MAIRYGIDLALTPSFTAKVHLVRQIVCDQYSSWSTGGQIVRMPLTPYFTCPDNRLDTLEEQVAGIAKDTRDRKPYVLRRSEVKAVESPNGLVIEFEAPEPLIELQRKAFVTAQEHFTEMLTEPFRPCVPLLEHVDFPEALLSDAAEFAEGVALGLDFTELALPWRLLLTRYTSEAAGGDWSDGRWAGDCKSQQLSSHRLYAEVSSTFELRRIVKDAEPKDVGGGSAIGRLFGRR